MLTFASSSPQITANAPRYSTPRKSPYTFRASGKTTIASSSPHNHLACSRDSGSASPATSSPRAPVPVIRSPKRPTSDAATQYSPVGLPPTSSRRSTSIPKSEPQTIRGGETAEATIADQKSSSAADAAQDAPPEPSATPRMRETPKTTLATSNADSSRPVSPSAPSGARPAVKRQKKSGEELTFVPSLYQHCNPKILAVLIADLLMDLVGHNDAIKLQDGHLTRFHSRTPPGISVHDYMQRLTHHATLPAPVLISMVNYIDKLCDAFTIFTINSLTVHRFLIAAATVAAKGLCDVFWTNSLYAKVGGVSKKELALLELELLIKTEWRIVPDTARLQIYYEDLVNRSSGFVREGDDPTSSSSTSSDSIGTDTMDTD